MQNIDSLNQVISRVDTLYINRVDPLYNESYIQLLEKSNEQLALIGNPLAWLIGALGVLFTIGAIAATLLIIRQSKEFTDKQDKLLNDLASTRDKYESDLESLVKAHQIQMEATNHLLNTLKNAGKVEENDLKKLRGSIQRSTNAIKKASRDIPIIEKEYRQRGRVKCEKCNEIFPAEFSYKADFSKGSRQNFKRTCPKCGHINDITILN